MPNLVDTLTNGMLQSFLTEKQIIRTADGTIHVVISYTSGDDSVLRHYYSRNDGATWSYNTLYTKWSAGQAFYATIDKDSNDNLYVAATIEGGITGLDFWKATVTKGTPWTWSWGARVAISTGYRYKPDIVVDSNGYIHLVVGVTQTNVYWYRSINGGANWTATDLGASGDFVSTITKDSNNHLYVCVGGNNILKITYNGGTSWSVGGFYSPFGDNNYDYLVLITLSNDKLAVLYEDSSNNLKFRKTVNVSDITSWTDASSVATSIDGAENYQLTSITINVLRAYFCKSNKLYYSESLDGGGTWVTPVEIYSTGTNRKVIVTETPFTNSTYKTDFIWRNSLSSYTIYHDLYEYTPPPLPTAGGKITVGDPITYSIESTDILDVSMEQSCDVALRDVPLRTIGEVMDTGTYLINTLTLEFSMRLSDSEKTTLENIFNSNAEVTIYLQNENDDYWTFIGWLRRPDIVYEYKTIRPWKARLTFDIYTYSYSGSSVGTFSNQQLRLVGGTTLDYENIIDFTVSEETSVAIPNWVNQDASIDTNVWNKTLKRMIYTVRETEYRLYKLLQILTAHTAITLYDYIHGPTNKTAWLTSVRAEWVPLKKEDIASNAFINTPWTVEFEVIVQE